MQLIRNLILLREENYPNLKPKFTNNPLRREIQTTDYGLVLYSKSNNNFYLCSLKEDICHKRDLDSPSLNKLLSGDFTQKTNYYFIGDKFDPMTNSYNFEISKH